VQVTRLSAEVGTPYLSETNETLAYDMTGIIGISGGRKGVVYFTAPTNMLRSVLINMGERDVTHDMRLDLVGEIANTIAGNARAEFGSEFRASRRRRRFGNSAFAQRHTRLCDSNYLAFPARGGDYCVGVRRARFESDHQSALK
jgi:Chemotaxis phosphatase CheX